MAIALDATSNASGADNTAVTSLTWSHTCAGTDRALVVVVGMDDSTDGDRVITSVTFNGDSLTRIKRQDETASRNETVELWGMVNPDAATGNIVVTMAGGSVSILSGGAVSFTGVDQTSAAVAFPTTAGENVENDSTLTTTTITVANDQAWLVDGFVTTPAVGVPAADSPATAYANYLVSASFRTGGAYAGPFSTGSQTISWTVTDGFGLNDWCHAIIEVKPAAGGGGGGTTWTGWVGKGSWF